MPLEGEYEPSPTRWVREQVDAYERSGGRGANTLLDTGLPIVVVTTVGHKTGKIRTYWLAPGVGKPISRLVRGRGRLPAERQGLDPSMEVFPPGDAEVKRLESERKAP